jgi:hypothetical protein
MTEFITSYATNVLLPPWSSPGCKCWCFIVRLGEGPTCVENYLNSYFNGCYPGRAPYTYSPLFRRGDQFGLIVVFRQPEIMSTRPDSRKKLNYSEVFLAIPVYRSPGDDENAKSLVWVVPFAIGDSSWVMFGAREIFGLDMAMARFDWDKDALEELHVDLAMNVIRKFAPRSPSELLPCLHIKATDGEARPGAGAISGRLGKFIDRVAFDGGLPIPAVTRVAREKASRPLPPAKLENVKQFRDVHDPDAAVYRAIVAAQIQHSDLKPEQIVLYDPEYVHIEFMWSATMRQVLTSLFGQADHFTDTGPPPAHKDENDWKGLNRCGLEAALAFSFTSTVDFSVTKTLYTYEPLLAD